MGDDLGDRGERRWVTLREAAAALGVSKETVRLRARDGALDSRRTNRGHLLVALPAELVANLPPELGEVVGVGAKRRQAAKADAVEAELRASVARLEAEVAWLRAEIERRRWPGLRALLRRVWDGS